MKTSQRTLILSIGVSKEHEACDLEDIIRNILDEEEIEIRLGKIWYLMGLEVQLKKANIPFSGFFPNLPYIDRIDKMIQNYDSLYNQLDS